MKLVLLLVLAGALPACVGAVSPVACAFASDCVEGESCVGGQCLVGTPTCPKMTPTFASINASFFQVGCGAKSNQCHGTEAVKAKVNGLDLQTDAFKALLGDGTGAPADVVDGRPPGLLRVKPGDALNSLLVIKIKLKGDSDLYGAGMPFDRPGSICQDAVDVVSQWIAAGAKND
jgi:hypothetical protein